MLLNLLKNIIVKLFVLHFIMNGLKTYQIYKDIEFVNHGKAGDYYIKYNIGWYKNLEDNNWDRKEMNPTPVNLIPLQQTATDILGWNLKNLI